jgi:pimeloyl-ACP methyl ester carboxylesterase
VLGARTRLQAFGVALLVTVTSGGLASCATKPSIERTGVVLWRGCGAIECATLSVPLDRTHPNGRRITLALARRPADGRRLGVLLANPGGPGGSGIELLQHADEVFSKSVRDRFDIVSWDPRGVGASTAVDCGDDLDYFYSVNRTNAAASTARENVRVAKRFVAGCRRNGRGLLPFLSSRASVADMDAIRAAMGVRTISYLGFSYGTYLGALYADRYPTHVRTMVLDGAIDPAMSSADGTIRQAVGFDRALDAFLSWCRDNAGCHFASHGNPITAFHDLTSSLNHETLPAEVDGERRTLGPGEANIGIATALYAGGGRDGWEALGNALRDAARGDGSGLAVLSDIYTGRRSGGHYDNETDAFYAIGCLDAPAPPTLAAVTRIAVRAERAAPVFGASNAWLGLPCTYWPVKPDGKVGPIHAAGAPAILVIGTTDDPATPYASARALRRELDSARLLTYVGEGHTAYGRGDGCIDDKVDAYLISRQLPREGTRCN